MKHILFISYDGMTDPLGQSQVIPYLMGLTKAGYSFTILSCDKPDLYAANKTYVEDLIAGYPIRWCSIPYHKSPPVLSAMYDLYKVKQKIRELHAETPFDMVHTRPGIPTLAALWMKKRYGVKFLNDIRGFWADERVDGGMWNRSNPLFNQVYTYFKRHEAECLAKSDHNICLTYAARDEILGWKGLSNQPVKLEVIPCSVDLELFDPAGISEVAKKKWQEQLKIVRTDIIFTYLGSIGGWYLTDEMMRLCAMTAEKMPDAKFLFISPHRHQEIAAAAAQAGIPAEKLLIVSARRHEVPELLAISDFSIFFIKPCYSKLSSSPTKHGEIMAMGLPLITNAGVGDVEHIVARYDAGIVVKDFTEASFNHAIHNIVTHVPFDRERIRRGAMEFYSLGQAVKRYEKVYASILH